MQKQFIICAVLAVSVIANLVLGFMIFREVKVLQEIGYQKINFKILTFRDLFIKKILIPNKEVDFDTRLEMETAVRNLNDSDILAQWQKFTNSQTPQDTNEQAKKLLDLLIDKTYY